jgi:hypothetical protein
MVDIDYCRLSGFLGERATFLVIRQSAGLHCRTLVVHAQFYRGKIEFRARLNFRGGANSIFTANLGLAVKKALGSCDRLIRAA